MRLLTNEKRELRVLTNERRVLPVISQPQVPEQRGLIEVTELDHVLHSSFAEILTDSNRAEVVEGEGFVNIVYHGLHCDHLKY